MGEGETPSGGSAPPVFAQDFKEEFETLLRWRRDVRRFRTDPLPDGLLDKLLGLADLSPSVGNSQPWRIVKVEDAERRAGITAGFEAENKLAQQAYSEDRAAAYARLKLAGLREAPIHLAVFCDPDPKQGHGVGRRTMPETLAYSVVSMIHTFWLAARTEGVGVGWVSILNPLDVVRTLDVDEHWQLVAYLCVGFPVEEHVDPELERAGWQARTSWKNRLFIR